MTTPLALLGAADLAARWGYTRQGVHQLAARPGFPSPVAAVNGGRVRVWLLADVEALEQGRPELGVAACLYRQPCSPSSAISARAR